jgi:signal transduction histidine kinase
METANILFESEYCSAHPEASPGRYVMLSLSDTGSGMDEETLSHIFEPFFTTKGSGEGIGLGLATVQGIVKENGGFILVSSKLGTGTTVKIYLSRTDET